VLPCAILLRDLTHAWENYPAMENRECEAGKSGELAWRLDSTTDRGFGTKDNEALQICCSSRVLHGELN
jgi:hypothetical protein